MKGILVKRISGLGQFYLRQYLTEEVLTKRKLLVSRFEEVKIYVLYVWCQYSLL